MPEYKEVEKRVHNFDEQPVVEGTLKEKKEGQFGIDYVIDVNGEAVTIFGKTVLRTKLEDVETGSMVRITKLEDKKSENGRIYQDFKVEVAK